LAVAVELAEHRDGRLLLVLGEMLELGALSLSEHRRLGQELTQIPAAFLVAVAGAARELVLPARAVGMDAVFATDSEEALGLLLGELRPRDVVLVKASRGVRAECVVRGLVAAIGRAA
jgi:UDP-N-acetylmuramoyl-tripeptide--D-alanyl-D-alanine ligase